MVNGLINDNVGLVCFLVILNKPSFFSTKDIYSKWTIVAVVLFSPTLNIFAHTECVS